MDEEIYLSTGQAARICDVTIPTISKWCEERGLEHEGGEGIGKARRIKPSVLSEFLPTMGRAIPDELKRIIEGGPIEPLELRILVVGGRNYGAVREFFKSLSRKKFKLQRVEDGSKVEAHLKKNKPQLILVVVGGALDQELVWVKALRTEPDSSFKIVAITSQGDPASPAPFDMILPKAGGPKSVLDYIHRFKGGE